jgi:hypothetical protein
MNPALVTVTRTDPVSAYDGEAAANSSAAATRVITLYFIARKIPDIIVSQIMTMSGPSNVASRDTTFQGPQA